MFKNYASKKPLIWITKYCTTLALFFLTGNATAALTNATVVATKTSVTAFCQTSNVKLVFVNKDLLYYVDFSESENPAIHQFTNVTMASTPSISPDGQYVAYSTAPAPNTTQPSAVYIITFSETATPTLVAASPAYNPRWIKNAPTPTLVYTTSSESDSWNGKGKVTSKRIVAGVPVSTDSTIFANGSYNAGVSWDGRYLGFANEGKNAYMLDLQNTAAGAQILHRLHFRNKTTGVDTIIPMQTCNGSISSSRVFTNAMMYLDFGYSSAKYTQPAFGTWQQHDRIFIGNYNGAILKYLMVPADIPVYPAATALNDQAVGKRIGEPEWATHPYYASASIYLDRLFITGGSYYHSYNYERIYCLNLKDSTYLPLIKSKDTLTNNSNVNFIYPYIYIQAPTGFTEDQSWLSTPINAVRQPLVSHSSGAAIVRFVNNSLVSTQPIRSVALYGVNGRCLARSVFTSSKVFRFDLPVRSQTEVRLIKVKLTDGQSRTFQMIVQ